MYKDASHDQWASGKLGDIMSLKMLIGIKPKVLSIRQAKDLYRLKENSEKEDEYILEVWNQLEFKKIEDTIIAGNPEAFFDTIIHDMPPKGIALYIAKTRVSEILPYIKNAKQAKNIYMPFKRLTDNVCIQLLRKRADELSFAEIENANDIAAIKVIAPNAIPGSDPFFLIIQKWCSFCTTTEQIKEVREFVQKVKHSDYYYPIINKRTESILLIEIPKANTADTSKACFEVAPCNSAVKTMAFQKWLTFLTTPEEANGAYHSTTDKELRSAAVERIKELTKP